MWGSRGAIKVLLCSNFHNICLFSNLSFFKTHSNTNYRGALLGGKTFLNFFSPPYFHLGLLVVVSSSFLFLLFPSHTIIINILHLTQPLALISWAFHPLLFLLPSIAILFTTTNHLYSTHLIYYPSCHCYYRHPTSTLLLSILLALLILLLFLLFKYGELFPCPRGGTGEVQRGVQGPQEAEYRVPGHQECRQRKKSKGHQ